MSDRPPDSVDPKLLEILVCPLTKTPLEYDVEKQELISRAAKLAFPIRDGIPIMLAEEARRLDGQSIRNASPSSPPGLTRGSMLMRRTSGIAAWIAGS